MIGALALVGATLPASPTRGDLAGRYDAGQQRAKALQSQINADSQKIEGYQGSIGELRARLGVIERSLAVQGQLLQEARTELAAARTRLADLEAQYGRYRQLLAAQLVADYESPPPTIVDVVVNASGFNAS